MQITRKDNAHPIPMVSGDEYDALTNWKQVFKVFGNRTGLARYAKRKYNKRLRKLEKARIKREGDV